MVRVTNLVRSLDRLKEAGFWCVGLEEGAAKTLVEIDPGTRVALVLGGEGSGLRRLTRERCDLLARLPTRGEARLAQRLQRRGDRALRADPAPMSVRAARSPAGPPAPSWSRPMSAI